MTNGDTRAILYLRSGNPDDPEGEVVQRLRQLAGPVDLVSIPYGKAWRRMLRALWRTRRLRRYQVVVSHEYRLAFAASLWAWLLRLPIRNIAVGFNLSSRPVRLGFRPIDRIFNAIFQRLDRIVVHSRSEIALFAKLHDLPEDRFRFSSWGFDAPGQSPESAHFHAESAPYFCLIGRNNRDFATFVQAIDESGHRGVIICGGSQSIDVPPTANVQVFRDLSMDECAACVRHSLANVILVNDADRGAGHITAVMGMLYKRPHIFSNVPTLHDYLEPGVHGIGVPVGDAEAVAAAMRLLASDPRLCEGMGEQAAQDARRLHSNEASTTRIVNAIMDAIQGKPETAQV